METIWKFELESTQLQAIEMPLDAEILTVQVQDNIPCIWALVDPTKKTGKRVFDIFGTGCDITSGGGIDREYIGTYQVNNGMFVFHVFEYIVSQ